MQVLNLIRPEESSVKYKVIQFPDIENPEVIEENQDLPLVVIDDLCDGGGTFKGIAQLLESHCPNRDRAIYVTHMVNPKGIATLSENYKEVYFTNSYRDWGREALPDNVKVIEVVLGLGMMSTPNSVENVLGFLLIVVIFYLSIKTKCLTTIKFKRDEK